MNLITAVKKIPRLFVGTYGLAALWLFTTAMHIPDGYLSPLTSMLMFIIVLPFWVRGVQKLREKLNPKNIPLVALLGAFSFVIMMFNIPLPGGTSGHVVGGALAAIILGPEIACIAVSIALVIQAFFFGDGGILNIGANCFNMAVVLPFISYAIYQAVSRNMPLNSKHRILGAAVGSWAGLTTASFFAAVEFGIQPIFWHTADGTPLYAPYSLSVSIPSVVIPHALVASVAEALVTVLVVVYLQRTNQTALEMVNKVRMGPEMSAFSRWRGLWIGLAGLMVATPLGLLAPGTAWGEWSSAELSRVGLSFIPAGMQQLTGLWSAPVRNYDLPALGNASLAYVFSAAVGILLTLLVVWLFSMLVYGRNEIAPEVVAKK